MKINLKIIVLITACSILSSNAMATNGDNLIAYGAISSAMGGAGVALEMGPEGILKNPALGYTEKEIEFMFAGTSFNPTVSANVAGAAEQRSNAKTFVIPSIGLISRINSQYSFGIGAYGVSGLGVDYRDAETATGLSKMYTSLSLIKFVPSLSYKNENFRAGIAVGLMYGTLSIAYDRTPNTTGIGMESPGKSEHLGTGYDLGVAYIWDKFTYGANYQSKTSMTYKYQLTQAAADFGIPGEISSDELAQPEEIALGVSYKDNNYTLMFDYRMISWASAEGYKQFGWDNQTVYSLGAAYQLSKETTLRGGYNYSPAHVLGSSAIGNSTSGARNPINFFNLVGFPATTKTHYTFGVSQNFSKTFDLDAALVFSPQITAITSFDPDGPGAAPAMTYESKHSQTSMTVAGRWAF